MRDEGDKRVETMKVFASQKLHKPSCCQSTLCAKMQGLSTTGTLNSSKSTYLGGTRSVCAPRLVASNTPTRHGGSGRSRTPLKIVAARVAGVEIPNAKKLEVSQIACERKSVRTRDEMENALRYFPSSFSSPPRSAISLNKNAKPVTTRFPSLVCVARSRLIISTPAV